MESLYAEVCAERTHSQIRIRTSAWTTFHVSYSVSSTVVGCSGVVYRSKYVHVR